MEGITLALVIIVMVFLLLLSIIPFLPGPVMLWSMATLYAVLTDFERVPVIAIIMMSVLMVMGATSEFWLRYLGMKGRGGSCWGFLGSFIGGILGTFLIPIPILGTLIGAVIGALLIEFMRLGEVWDALRSGRAILEMYLVNIVVEFSLSVSIFAVFLISVWLTA